MEKLAIHCIVCFSLVTLGQAAGLEGNDKILSVVSGSADTNFFWNVGNLAGDSAGYRAVTAAGPVTIVTDATHEIVRELNGKSLGGENFTQRLKLGGAGNPLLLPTARALKFHVGGNCLMEVFALSSSSKPGETRTMAISNGVRELHTDSVPGDHKVFSGLVKYPYIGPATDIYIYSKAKGLNIYGIRVTYGNSNLVLVSQIKGIINEENVQFEVYNTKGAKISTATGKIPGLREHSRGQYLIRQRKTR